VVAAGGVGYTLIGSDASDRSAYSPARLTRLRLVRRSFRRDVVAAVVPAGDGSATPDVVNETPPPDAVIVTGPLADAVWPRVMADPSAIAHAIVSKYDDLLPLNRQEKITAREGFKVPCSPMREGRQRAAFPRQMPEPPSPAERRTILCRRRASEGLRHRYGVLVAAPWRDREHTSSKGPRL
jgi:transposase